MNLSMQTRRAFITLSLAATAMVFVLAKTSMGADAQAHARSNEPVRAETVFVAKETFSSPVIIPVHITAPTLVAKQRSVRKTVRARCESVSKV
jgi:hypothetical protein